MAEHIKLITEEVAKPLSQVEADWAKSYAEKEEAKKAKKRLLTAVLGYTEQKVLINGHQRTVHRVFVETLDSGAYSKLGWILKGDVTCCMICAKEFLPEVSQAYFFEWNDGSKALKSYCYACGNIICSECRSEDSIVKELASVGAVPVCKQCSYGQDEVGIAPLLPMPPSYRVHQKVASAASAKHSSASTAMKTTPSMASNSASPTAASTAAAAGAGARSAGDKSLMAGRGQPPNISTVSIEDAIPRVWKYGNVRVEKVIPAFCYEARTKEKTRVFINVCTHSAVPFNLSPDQPHKRTAPLTKKGQELCLLIGEKGISASVEGAVLYDVAVHPMVVAQCGLDATAVLKERICAEILRSLRRLELEPEFTIFSYFPTAAEGVYHPRHLTYQQKLAAQSDEDAWRADFRKALPKKVVTDNFGDLAEEEDLFANEGKLRVYLPMPSISAFFHMEQIVVGRGDLERPLGLLDRRWHKYAEITQLADGTLYIPNNKRARKAPSAIGEIPQPVLLSEVTDDRALDRYGGRLKTFSASLYAANGFLITGPRTSKTSKEDVVVHVLHHPFVDEFARSGLLEKDRDDLDPLLMVCKKSFKVKQQDGTTQRAYNVLVGSSYIVGIEDLTGRRILAPERITKILRRVNVVFEEEINIQKYVLSGIDKRPVTEPSPLSVYTYERPLFGTVSEDAPRPRAATGSGSIAGSAANSVQDASSGAYKTKPAAAASAPAQQQPHHRPTSSWDANSVLSDLSMPDGPLGTYGAPASSMSHDASPDDGSTAMRQSTDSAHRKSTTKRLKHFFLGSRSASQGVPIAALGSDSIDFTQSQSVHGETEHKAVDSPERKMHQHRPSPLTIHTSPVAAAQVSPSGAARAQLGIASMSEEDSSRSGASAIAAAPKAIPGASPGAAPASTASTPAGGGLGLGAMRGLAISVPALQKSSSRTSIASVHSDLDEQDADSAVSRTKAAPALSIFARESPTPLHNRQGGGNARSAAQEALNDEGNESSTSVSPAPEAGLPPSSRHSLRAFFTRENSGASTIRHTISGGASHSRSTSTDVQDLLPQTSNTAAAATPATPSASAPGGMLRGISLRLSGSGSHSNATTPRANSGGVTPSASAKLARGVKPAAMQGKELVSPDMLEYAIHLSVNRAVSEGLIKQSAKDPAVLFGWQVRVSAHMQEEGKGLYVISAVTKNVIGPPDFRLTNLIKDDAWVRLKRGNQEGLAFTPVRKVLTLED